MAFSTCRYILISAATQVVDGVDRILLFLLASCFLHVPRPPEVDEAHDWGGCVDGRVWPRQWLGADQAFAKKVRLCGKRKEARPSLAPRIPRAGGQENEWLAWQTWWQRPCARISHLAPLLSPFASGPWVAYHGNPNGLRLPSTDLPFDCAFDATNARAYILLCCNDFDDDNCSIRLQIHLHYLSV